MAQYTFFILLSLRIMKFWIRIQMIKQDPNPNCDLYLSKQLFNFHLFSADTGEILKDITVHGYIGTNTIRGILIFKKYFFKIMFIVYIRKKFTKIYYLLMY